MSTGIFLFSFFSFPPGRSWRWRVLGLLLLIQSVTLVPSASGADLLRTGTFHGDEVPADAPGTWLGLVPAGEGEWKLVGCQVAVKQVFDPIVDPEGLGSGKEVSVAGPLEPLFLVRGITGLRAGRVSMTAAGPLPLEISRPIALDLPPAGPYSLALACGAGTPTGEDGFAECPLVLTGAGLSQVLATFSVYQPSSAGAMIGGDASPALLWAGDLDRDGRLDLLLDLTGHYNVSSPTLFLSSLAKSGELVGKAAEHRTYGC